MYTKVLETKEILASLFFYTVISVKGKGSAGGERILLIAAKCIYNDVSAK